MVEKTEIHNDELFIRAMQKSRAHFREQFLDKTQDGYLRSTLEWEAYLYEHGITWDFMDRFYYYNEEKLSFFIMKWS